MGTHLTAGLLQQLGQCLLGRVVFVGVGNVEYGDDGFGVRLAEQIGAAGVKDVIIAGTTPDRWIGRFADPGFDNVVFLDAIEFNGSPGSVVFLNSSEMAAALPQISTHKISLGLLARWIEATGGTKAWLLGVQPGSLKTEAGLTAAVQCTLDIVRELLLEFDRLRARGDTRATGPGSWSEMGERGLAC